MKASDSVCEATVSIEANGKVCDEHLVTRDSTEMRCWIGADGDDKIKVDYSFTFGDFDWHVDLVIDGILVKSREHKYRATKSTFSSAFNSCIWREGDDTQVHSVGMKFSPNNGQSSCIGGRISSEDLRCLGWYSTLPLGHANGTGMGAIEVIFYRSDDEMCYHNQTRASIFDDYESRCKARASVVGELPLTHYVTFVKRPSGPISSSQKSTSKKIFNQDRPGRAPWVSFKFMYRSQAELWQAHVASPSMREDTNRGIHITSAERRVDATSDMHERGAKASTPLQGDGVEPPAQDSVPETSNEKIVFRLPPRPSTSGANPSLLEAEAEAATATPSPDPRKRARDSSSNMSNLQRTPVAIMGHFHLDNPPQQFRRRPGEEHEEAAANRPEDTPSGRQRRQRLLTVTSTSPNAHPNPSRSSTNQRAASGVSGPVDIDRRLEQLESDIPRESSVPRDQEDMKNASAVDSPSHNRSLTLVRTTATPQVKQTGSDDVENLTVKSARLSSEDPRRKRRRERIEELEREKGDLEDEVEEAEIAWEEAYEANLEKEVEQLKSLLGHKKARLSALMS
ncbi:MAG: hypothetical protein M1816_003134 [Peltula sp. TS41687]|nr:MAG: hypothetical protein M1816_003134 [Peltula sp. TS41687]